MKKDNTSVRKEALIPIGTFVSIQTVESPIYGIVVDSQFWREQVEKDDLKMLEHFDRASERAGFQPIPVMLLRGRLNQRVVAIAGENNSIKLVNEDYAQRFIWGDLINFGVSSVFNDTKDFLRVMDFIKPHIGGESLLYLKQVILHAEKIAKYLEDPNFDSHDFFNQAFPGMKAKPVLVD